MDKRLKQQRRRLFLRVTLILSAVWLAVSATYCAICLYNEKNGALDRHMALFSYAQQQLYSNAELSESSRSVWLTDMSLVYFKEHIDKDGDSQIIVIDEKSGRMTADTANKTGVLYGIATEDDTPSAEYGYIDHDTLCGALSGAQLQKISEWLHTPCESGKSYQAVCTKFHIIGEEIIPLEIRIALVSENDRWFFSDTIADTFSLDSNTVSGQAIFRCDELRRNIIPAEFLLGTRYNRDYIGSLTDEQRSQTSCTVRTAPLQYVLYASGYLYLNTYNLSDEDAPGESGSYTSAGTFYTIQYAQKIDLLQSCIRELLIGTAVIFVFFLLIAVILCVMIWKIVRVQIIQEQKRTDLTNALAHDIKTPLFVISGYAYSLQENIDDDERDRYLNMIIVQTDKINGLVHKMLELSKLDSCAVTLNPAGIDLAELLSEVLADYTVLPDGKQLAYSHNESSIVRADPELLKTVFENLTDNAVRYALPDSTIQIRAVGRTVTFANESELLTKAELKQIWQPYVRKDKSRRQYGSGLGLSIVKSILDLHDAKYDIRQNGQTFVVTIEFP